MAGKQGMNFRSGNAALTLTVDGVSRVMKKAVRLDKEMESEILKSLMRTALLTETDAKLRVVYDTGRLRSSIHWRQKVKGKGLAIFEVAANAHYAAFVEFGTAVMGRQTAITESVPSNYVHGTKHFPPWEALVKWVKKHPAPGSEGDDPEDSAKGLAIGIASRPGLPAKPYLWPAYESQRKPHLRRIRQLLNGAAKKAGLKRGQR